MRVVLVVRLLLITSIILIARAVFAQPAPEPGCDVRIVRAPDPVRSAIEARLRAESRCEATLALRVVPTSAGLYLLAHTASGRVYEMVVPDPATAADLVAVWVMRREPPITAPRTATARARPAIAVRVQPPGVTPEAVDGVAPVRDAGTWLSVGGVLGDAVYGVRGELDVLGRSGWSGGIGLEISAMRMTFPRSAAAVLEFRDVRAVAALGYTLGRGDWQARLEAGVGVVGSQVAGYLVGPGGMMRAITSDGVYPIGEAALQITRMLGARWALSAGPMLTIYSQRYRLDVTDELVASRDLDVSLLAGLRRRL